MANVTTKTFPGMNNADRISPVRVIHNMDVTRDGKLVRRDGYTLWLPLPGAHSLHFDGRGFLCLAAGSATPESLYRVTLDRQVTELCPVIGIGDPLFVAEAAGRLYLSSRSWNGVLEGDVVRPWGSPRSDDPADLAGAISSEEYLFLNTSGPPPLEHLAVVGGRILGSTGGRVCYSDPPFAYELFRPDTFHEFPGEIAMIAVQQKGGVNVTEGIFIATEEKTWFAAGYEPEKWDFAEVGDGVLAGTLQYLPSYKGYDNVPVWIGRRGVVAGISGTIQPLTEQGLNMGPLPSGRAASLYRPEREQYLASFPAPSDVGFGDAATCEVLRRGKLIMGEYRHATADAAKFIDRATCEVVAAAAN